MLLPYELFPERDPLFPGQSLQNVVDEPLKAAVVVLCIPAGLEGFVDDVLQALAREQLIPFREEFEGEEQYREKT